MIVGSLADANGGRGWAAVRTGEQRTELVVFAFCFLYFAAKTIFLATRIGENIFPDEETWFGLSQLFSYTFWPPADSPLSYKFGLIAHTPTLYFWLMGRALSLNFFPLADLVFLRLLNVALGLAAVVYGWRLARLLALGLASRLFFLVLLTNTMMFTFLQAAVNYDNLVNLCAILALYQLVRFFREREIGAAMAGAVFLLLGALSKVAFLPYAFGLLLLVAVHERKSWSGFFPGLRRFFGRCRWSAFFLSFLILLLLGVNCSLYGGNLLRYRRLVPTPELVLPIEACLKNRLFTRNYVVEQYKNGKLDLLAAQRLALQIRNPGDRQDALFMLRQAVLEKGGTAPPRFGVVAYARQWLAAMLARTYGVAGHLAMAREGMALLPYYLLFLLAGLLAFGQWGRGRGDGFAAYLLGLTGFYAGILFWVINYQGYLASGMVGVALTGRYLFPVLVPCYLWVAHSLLDHWPPWWQWGLGGVASAFFILAEFPWFLRQVTPAWYF